jgi:DNA mismatch repair protein MutL
VHPTKTEIKFDNEQPIWQVLSAAVRESVGKFSGVPLIDFDVEGKPDIPAMGASPAMMQQPRTIATSYNPFADEPDTEVPSSHSYRDTAPPTDWEKLYPSAPSSPVPSSLNLWDDVQPEVPSHVFDNETPLFQYKGRYIIYPDASGLIAVDQYRAHLRVLFERNMACFSTHARPSQKKLFPEIVQFTIAESVVLDGAVDILLDLGIELTSLGGGSYAVSGMPADQQGLNADQLLHDIVSMLQENPGAPLQQARETTALQLARSSAIVYGQVLSTLEMNQLLHDLFATSAPARTPDGKVIYAVIDSAEIAKLFG